MGPGTTTTNARASKQASSGKEAESVDGSVAVIIALFVGGFLLMLWATR